MSMLLHLLKQHRASSNRAEFDFIIEQQWEKIAKQPKEDPEWRHDTRLHPSSVSVRFCPREHQLSSYLQKKRKPPEPSLQRIFSLGHAVHFMYQNEVFGPAGVLYGRWADVTTARVRDGRTTFDTVEGFMPSDESLYGLGIPRWIYVEPAIVHQDNGIVGHCDGIIVNPHDQSVAILEIKSISSTGWKALSEPKPEHIRQASIYAASEILLDELPGVPDKILFVYVNKENCQEKTYVVSAEGFPEDIADDAATYYQNVENAVLSSRKCFTPHDPFGSQCSTGGACWADGIEADFQKTMIQRKLSQP
jgi:hypothetical protein